MLDQLGLGVVLSLEDQFTPQANKALQSFDRLQNGADQMTKQVTKSMMSLQNLMLAGFSLDQIGTKFQTQGKKLLGVVSGIFKGVANVGARFETLRKTMSTFFKEETDEAMKWGVSLASKTPFQIESVLNAMKTFKAIGIDARKQFKGVNGEMQSFMEYVGDLGAFNPAQGVEGAMFAIRELMGGQVRSLKTRFDINPELILGRKINMNDVEKMQTDVVELISKLAPNMMKNLEGTFDQLISNLQDKWTWFTYLVAENGAFDPIKKTLSDLMTLIDGLDLDRVAKTFGNIFGALWKPVDSMVKGITKIILVLTEFAEKNPQVAKLAIGLMAVAGAGMIVTGAFMKLFGGTIITFTAIASLILNLKVFSQVGATSVMPLVRNMGKSFLGFGLKLGLVGLALAGLYTVWKKDMFGIRTIAEKSLDKIKTAWQNATDFIDSDRGIISSRTLDNLSLKFARLQSIGKALATILFQPFDKTAKTMAKYNEPLQWFPEKDVKQFEALGILGLVQELVTFKAKLEVFWDGFSQGALIAFGIMKNFIDFVLIPFKAVWKAISPLVEPLLDKLSGKFTKDGILPVLSDETLNKWQKLGLIVGGLLTTLLAFKGISIISSLISPLGGLLKSKEARAGKTAGAVASGGLFGGLFGRGKGSGGATRTPNDLLGLTKRQKIAEIWNRHDKHPLIRPENRGKKYNRINPSDSFSAHQQILGMNNPGALNNNLYVKNKPNLMRKFFGDSYYTKNGDGKMNKIGRFGGLFNVGRDDDQIKMFTQKKIGNGVQPSGYDLLNPAGSKADMRSRVRTDRQVGHIMPGMNVKNSALKVHNLTKSIETMRNKAVSSIPESEYESNINRRFFTDKHFGFMDKKQWDDNYKGKDGKDLSASELAKKPELRKMYQGFVKQYASPKNLGSFQTPLDSSKQLYADGKQGIISKLLFGQKLYTNEQDKNGKYYKNVVSRRGGVFRKPSDDYSYKDEGRGGVRGFIESTKGKAKKGLGAFGDITRSRFSNSWMGKSLEGTKKGLGMFGKMAKESFSESHMGKAFKGISKGFGMFGKNVKSQFARVGMDNPLQVMFGKSKRGVGAIGKGVGFLGKGLWGGTKLAGKGLWGGAKLAGRGVRGAGRGALNLGKGLVRGAGRGAMGALRMLPLLGMGIGLGKTAYDLLSGGEGKEGIKKNVDKITQYIKAGKLNDVWKSFKETAKVVWDGIKQIGSAVWAWIKKDGVKVLGEAWEGIKALATIAWAWMKTDGVIILGELWEKLKIGAGLAWDWVKTEGKDKMLEFTTWMATDGVPAIWDEIEKLGVWLWEEGIPEFLLFAVEVGKIIGTELLKALSNAVTNFWTWFSKDRASRQQLNNFGLTPEGVNSTTPSYTPPAPKKGSNNFMDKFSTTPTNVHGYKVNHSGLWMSPEESNSIIRKDETVLPPTISKGFDAIIRSFSRGGTPTSNSTPVQQDNSIKIDKVEIVVVAEKLSRTDARKQAQMMLEEFEKLKKEKSIRQYKPVTQ